MTVVTVVDVRAHGAYIAEHIAGAVNVPLAAMGGHEFPMGNYMVFYCSGTGCPLSGRAAEILTGKGYKNAAALTGGIEAWKSKGLPVVSEEINAAGKLVAPAYAVAKVSVSELFA